MFPISLELEELVAMIGARRPAQGEDQFLIVELASDSGAWRRIAGRRPAQTRFAERRSGA